MKTKNAQLDELFKLWPREEGKSFVKDGIINEDKFHKARYQVLFIMKEPNYPKTEDWDFREVWATQPEFRIGNTISKLAYGILNRDVNGDFPVYSNIDRVNEMEAIQSIAYMNLKKSGGGNVSQDGVLHAYLAQHRAFIKKQIDIIKPNLIILGFNSNDLSHDLFEDFDISNWTDSGYGRIYLKTPDNVIVDFHHPSARIPDPVYYVFVEKILKQAFAQVN